MASEHTITHFPPLPQHSYNSLNLPGLLSKSSQGSLGPTVLHSLLFPVKYGLNESVPMTDKRCDLVSNLCFTTSISQQILLSCTIQNHMNYTAIHWKMLYVWSNSTVVGAWFLCFFKDKTTINVWEKKFLFKSFSAQFLENWVQVYSFSS